MLKKLRVYKGASHPHEAQIKGMENRKAGIVSVKTTDTAPASVPVATAEAQG